MAAPHDITVQCPLCNGAIIYPPDREGEEVPCPHCNESIYLLSEEPPAAPSRSGELQPKTVLVRPDHAPPTETVADDPTAESITASKNDKDVVLHAATQQKLHSGTKRKAVIKRARNHPGATPPNRKKISPPESNVLKIPHLFAAVELEREGTKMSPELILRHPQHFTLDRSGGGLRKKSSIWECRWTAIHIQSDRHAKPWVSLLLSASLSQPGCSNGLALKTGNKLFDLATDAAWNRAREESERGAREIASEGTVEVKERFSFEHDDFRYLCGELALNEAMSLTIDGIGEPIDEDTCAEFREYTLEFFEALRRLYPIFFR